MIREIQAAVLREPSAPFQIETLQIESPRHNEVQVQILGVGICHTDVKMAQGYRALPLPLVLGHEGAGIVTAVGSGVRKVKVGDHVVLSFNSCGHCDNCQSGHPAVCDEVGFLSFGCERPSDGSSPLSQNGAVVHGYFFAQSSFATHAIATERNVVKVPDDIPLELLGPLGCGIQTGAGTVLNSLQVEAGSTLAVFGTGSVGLSAVMAAVIAGATTIIAIDLNDRRLALALELGATHTLNPQETPDLVAAIKEICGGKGVHYSLDTTNVPSVVRKAFDCLRIRGTYGHVGGTGTELTFSATQLIFGRTIMGIVQGDSVPDIFIPRLIELYRQGRFPFDRLVTYYEFADINQAVADMHAGTTIKPILRAPSASSSVR
ncbi:MAG: NAD(P)-dependent alcohol dehydrogenase [Ardenticatenaceae bacterium]